MGLELLGLDIKLLDLVPLTSDTVASTKLL